MRVSAKSRETSCSWRPRYMRYVVHGRAHAGVVERLEHRRRRPATRCSRVHVVDRVDELAVDAELARRRERRAVLDVALAPPASTSSSTGCGGRPAAAGRDRRRRTPASPTGTPRRSRRRTCRARGSPSAPARVPAPIARSSIVGFMPSMTVRTSFGGSSPEDAQARVLLALAAARAAQEPREEAERDDRTRRDDDAPARRAASAAPST